jgi:hypothetical protein
VDHVDGTGRPLYVRTTEAMPRLVEQGAGKGKVPYGDRERIVIVWRAEVRRRDPYDLDMGPLGQGAGQSQRRHGGAAGNAMPELLERQCDA